MLNEFAILFHKRGSWGLPSGFGFLGRAHGETQNPDGRQTSDLIYWPPEEWAASRPGVRKRQAEAKNDGKDKYGDEEGAWESLLTNDERERQMAYLKNEPARVYDLGQTEARRISSAYDEPLPSSVVQPSPLTRARGRAAGRGIHGRGRSRGGSPPVVSSPKRVAAPRDHQQKNLRGSIASNYDR